MFFAHAFSDPGVYDGPDVCAVVGAVRCGQHRPGGQLHLQTRLADRGSQTHLVPGAHPGESRVPGAHACACVRGGRCVCVRACEEGVRAQGGNACARKEGACVCALAG